VTLESLAFANNTTKLSLDSIWQRCKDFGVIERNPWFCKRFSKVLSFEQILDLIFGAQSVNGYTYVGGLECICKRPNFKFVELPLSSELIPEHNWFQQIYSNSHGVPAYRPVSRSLIPLSEKTRFVGILCSVS
jgi:hypothetical protein